MGDSNILPEDVMIVTLRNKIVVRFGEFLYDGKNVGVRC